MINKDKEVGGKHYSEMVIEPIELIDALNLDFSQGNIVKYISRYRHKKGLEDLEKALHYSMMNICADQWHRVKLNPDDIIERHKKLMVKMYCILNGLSDWENMIIMHAVSRQYKKCSEEIQQLITKYEEQ